VYSLKFKSAYLLISSLQGERMKVRGIYLDSTLTPTLSRQRERGGMIDFYRLIFIVIADDLPWPLPRKLGMHF
jgi:hypothetical protein